MTVREVRPSSKVAILTLSSAQILPIIEDATSGSRPSKASRRH
jgi:hypothetical protein